MISTNELVDYKIYDYETIMNLNKKRHYDYKTIIDINSKNLCLDNSELVNFFDNLCSYKITKDMKQQYINKKNKYFNKEEKRPKSIICDDSEIIKNIRSLLGKISVQNYDTIRDKIVDICDGKNISWKELSEQFYTIIIDNIFIIDIYVKLLIDLENKGYIKLIYNIHHLIIDQIKNPRNFTVDSLSETGVDKIKRWKISNAILLTTLFNNNKYSKDFINKQIDHWLSLININNCLELEILLKIVPLFDKNKYPVMNDDIKGKMNEIKNNKSYPGRIRLMLEIK